MENSRFLDNSINNVLDKINDNNKIMLPAIQRKFVWKEEKILKFIDSILLGYPIGIFLFWQLKGSYLNENKKAFTFYKFIDSFNDREITNNKSIETFKKDIDDYIAVLDGQQRLTALNIAINGYIETKRIKYGKNSDLVKKYLYINLLTKSKKEKAEDELYYDLEFIREDQKEEYEKNLWRPISEIVNNIKNKDDIEEYIDKLEVNCDKFKVANNIRTVYEAFNDVHKLPYYLIKDVDMDTVLELFVRVNSGGQVLQKSDLLFSTIISSWIDGREKIDNLIDILNRKYKGGTFNFNIDYIMRTCLYLLDKPLDMKVENFKTDNAISKIEKEWDNIENALKETVNLLEERQFNNDNITSYNAIMPIIYYIYKGGNYKDTKVKEELYKYFIIAQIKQVFGGSSNSILKSIRDILTDEHTHQLKNKKFNLSQLDKFSSGNRNFYVDEKEIDNWFKYRKGQYTYLILSLIKDGMDLGISFHQDHMHPNTILSKDVNFSPYKDKLANMQLIPASKNLTKNKEELKDWIKEGNVPQDCPINEKNEYIYTNSKDFLDFYTARRKILKGKIMKTLGLEYNKEEVVDITKDIDE